MVLALVLPMVRHRVADALMAMLLLAACSSKQIGGSVGRDGADEIRSGREGADGAPSDLDGVDASTLPQPITHGTGATDLLVGYSVGGGYSGFGSSWVGLPIFALFGDGRLVFATVGANPTSYEMQEARVAQADIAEILARANTLGLLAESTTLFAGLDTDDAVLMLQAADRCVTHQATPPEVDGGAASLAGDMRQLLGRDAVAATVVPWSYESVALTFNWTTLADCAQAPAWPFEAPPADAAINDRSCRVVDRQAASMLAPAAPQRDRMLATSGDRCLAYDYRPLLPGEVGCPGRFAVACPP